MTAADTAAETAEVAAGLIAYGVCELVNARYRRIRVAS